MAFVRGRDISVATAMDHRICSDTSNAASYNMAETTSGNSCITMVEEAEKGELN